MQGPRFISLSSHGARVVPPLHTPEPSRGRPILHSSSAKSDTAKPSASKPKFWGQANKFLKDYGALTAVIAADFARKHDLKTLATKEDLNSRLETVRPELKSSTDSEDLNTPTSQLTSSADNEGLNPLISLIESRLIEDYVFFYTENVRLTRENAELCKQLNELSLKRQ